jgi:hypothetical protein
MAGHDEAGCDDALPDLRRMMAVRAVWLYERLRASLAEVKEHGGALGEMERAMMAGRWRISPAGERVGRDGEKEKRRRRRSFI